MQPALSIIVFTTASGAGLGLLALLGLGAPLGFVLGQSSFAFVALIVAAALAGGGLLSSAAHLGRPERAWRALSQWRSSWLSREGIFAVLTVPPAAIFGIGWVFFGATAGVVGFCGILAAMLSLAALCSTGMIYASLKPIHQWHNIWVVPGYLALGLMSGWLLLGFLERLWGGWPVGATLLALVATLAGWWIKEMYWRSIDTGSAASTVASATALGSRGKVRLFEAPHTQDNYLLQEMGFRLARKHKARLRLITRLALFLLPALFTLIALFRPGVAGAAAAGLAAASAALGLLVERWLFFAEAKHTVTLYYGAEAV